ncbi:GYD domain-containing protein [Leptospira interrogans]
MPKYLIKASYSAEGVRGLRKDKASGRKAAVAAALEGLGGKLETMYYAFGDADVFAIVEMPDNASIAAFSLTAAASGVTRTTTTALLTIEEADAALEKTVNFRAAGK